VYLVLRLEHRALPPERPERMAVVAALDLPWDAVLVTSAWLDGAVGEQHPVARRRRVGIGHWGVAAGETTDGPMRIANAPVEVLEAMEEEWAPANGGFDVLVDVGEEHGDEPGVLSPLSPILTAFSLGATAVTVPTEGRDELVVHRETGLVVEPDDVLGTARALDSLARDRELLAQVRAGAAAAASAWPTWEAVGAELRGSLDEVLSVSDAGAAAGGAWVAALMDDVTGEAAKLAAYESARMDEMRAWAARIEEREAALGEPRSPLGRFRGRRS